jgi:hypothetical protein
MIKYLLKYQIIMAAALLLLVTACQKKYPGNVTDSTDDVVLESIKIINAGAGGNTVVEGVVNEDKKTVSFPRLDVATDFSTIKFQAVTSSGASLEKEVYEFAFGEGASEQTNVVKVVHNKRFREYLVTLRLLIPVFGADFSKPDIYDYSANPIGNPTYADFTGQLTRGTGFDGQHVLVVARTTGSAPHLLKVSDLKNNIINKIPLDLTNVSGGTFPYSVGIQTNGHTYVANLSGTTGMKIYHWTDPSVAPQIILNVDPNTIPGAGARHGDNMSMDLDENGNGYMYFGDNAVTEVLRFTVSNYTTVTNPVVLPTATGATAFMSFNRIVGTNEYLFSGYDGTIRLADENASIAYSLSTTVIPRKSAGARIIDFNGERYLILTTAARSAGDDLATFYIYDITKGSTVKEALENFAQRADKSYIYTFSLGGPVNLAPNSQAGYYITKDGDGNDKTLTVFASSTDAGFVIIDFPKKSLED